MPLQLLCACGNQLRVPEAHAGKRVQCPRCGASHLVSEQPQAPARPRQPVSQSGKLRRLLVLALLLFLLVAAVTAGWWFLRTGKAPLAEDLTLIPADAPAFVSMRLRELWETPLVQQLLDEEKKQAAKEPLPLGHRIAQLTGLLPAQVERVSLVSVDLERRIGWTVVRATIPYHPPALLSRLRSRRDMDYEGITIHVGSHPDAGEVAVTFLTPTILVVSNETGVRRCLDHRRSWSHGAPGPLSPILALCEKPHHIVAGFHATPETRQQATANEALAPLAGVRQAQLTADVGAEALLEARAQAADEEQATKLVNQANTWLTLAKGYLLVAGFKGGEQGKAAQQASKLLGQLKIEQQGTNLRATMKADAASLVGALGALPNLPGR